MAHFQVQWIVSHVRATVGVNMLEGKIDGKIEEGSSLVFIVGHGGSSWVVQIYKVRIPPLSRTHTMTNRQHRSLLGLLALDELDQRHPRKYNKINIMEK